MHYDFFYLISLDPDQNNILQLQQNYFGSSEYYCESTFKTLINSLSTGNDFSFLHKRLINVRSLSKNFEGLSTCLDNLNYTFNVIGLTETWLTDNTAGNYLEDYKHIFRCREGRGGGGVSLLINSSLHYKERCDFEKFFDSSSEVVAVEIKLAIIVCIYRLPNCDLSAFITDISNALDIISNERENCYIMGDFNINIENSQGNMLIKEFTDTMYSYSFNPMISVPTRVTNTSATHIDNIFTNVYTKTGMNSFISIN